jgi:hypothetical protein
LQWNPALLDSLNEPMSTNIQASRHSLGFHRTAGTLAHWVRQANCRNAADLCSRPQSAKAAGAERLRGCGRREGYDVHGRYVLLHFLRVYGGYLIVATLKSTIGWPRPQGGLEAVPSFGPGPKERS